MTTKRPTTTPAAQEKALSQRIVKALNAIPSCHVEKTVPGPYGTKGKADISGCLQLRITACSAAGGQARRAQPPGESMLLGVRLELEVKRPDTNHQVTDVQAQTLVTWARVGALCAVVTSVEEVLWLFDGLVAHTVRLGASTVWVSRRAKVPADSPLRRHDVTLCWFGGDGEGEQP